MAARTGTQFLAGLKSPRDIWVGDEKVDDVASHPAFAGGARTMAQIDDVMAHDARLEIVSKRSLTNDVDRKAEQHRQFLRRVSLLAQEVNQTNGIVAVHPIVLFQSIISTTSRQIRRRRGGRRR